MLLSPLWKSLQGHLESPHSPPIVPVAGPKDYRHSDVPKLRQDKLYLDDTYKDIQYTIFLPLLSSVHRQRQQERPSWHCTQWWGIKCTILKASLDQISQHLVEWIRSQQNQFDGGVTINYHWVKQKHSVIAGVSALFSAPLFSAENESAQFILFKLKWADVSKL